MLRARNNGQTVFMKAADNTVANLRLLIASAKDAFGDGAAADLLNVPDKDGSTPLIRPLMKASSRAQNC